MYSSNCSRSERAGLACRRRRGAATRRRATRRLAGLWLLLIGAAACGRRPAPPAPALPQTSGSLAVSGLAAPVRIVRDRWGVPHVYAASQADLFFAQGFVQAQDRLFQMDLWRRAAQGRLAEVLGANFVERDAMTRRIQYTGGLDEDWASYGADARAIAEAFVRGVNAWIDIAGPRLPLSFALAGWRPEHWQAADLTNRTDAFLASGDAGDEVLRVRLIAAVGAVRARRLAPDLFPMSAAVPRELDPRAITYQLDEALRAAGAPPFFAGLAAPVPPEIRRSGPTDPAPEAPPRPDRLERNTAWAVGAARSRTGAPLLAVDAHGRLAHPARWYLIHLSAPGWNVAGAAAPWRPGIVIGHNDQIGWGWTRRDADVQDLYVERLNPASLHQVRSGARWVETSIVEEPLFVKGMREPLRFRRESSAHGVFVASDSERHLAFALRWTGFEPGAAAELAALSIDRARSPEALRAAIRRWKLPAATFVYIARDGRLGTVEAGWSPVRIGFDGAVPVPGWTDRYEWRAVRPPDGRSAGLSPDPSVVLVAGGSRPRLHRLEAALSAGAFGVDDFARLLQDSTAWIAGQIVPRLERVRSDRPDVEEARQRLLAWDRRLDARSPDAALYAAWERALRRRLAAAALGPSSDASLASALAARAGGEIVAWALAHPSAWFGGGAASGDELLLAALGEAVDRLRRLARGAPPSWGSLHTALFHHPLAATSDARRLLDVGPFARGGYGETLLTTTAAFESSAARAAGDEQIAGSTLSLILDASDWDRSLAIAAPGQSGEPGSPHFADLAPLWAGGGYVQLAFSERAVEAVAESTLVLVPAR